MRKPLAVCCLAGMAASASADLPPDVARHAWTDSPLATARVVGCIDSPDGEATTIEIIAPAAAAVRFGTAAAATPISPRFGAPQQMPIGTDPEGDVPVDIKYQPDGSSYYILHRTSRNIVRFNASTNQPVRVYPVSGVLPTAMEITPDGSTLIVANFTEDTVSFINTSTGAETVLATGDGPGTVSITPDGTRALIGCVMDSTLRVLSIAMQTEERSIATPGYTQVTSFGLESGVVDLRFPNPVTFLDASRIVFPGRFNSLVAIINFATGARTDIPTLGSPAGAAVSGNGAVIAVSHADANGVTTIIDPTTLTVLRTIDSPGSATRANGPIVLNSDGTRAVIAFQNAARSLNLTTDTFSGALGTANLEDLLVNPARTRVIGIGFSGAIIDFATGGLLGTPNNTVSCTRGAISPVADRAVLTSWPTFGDDMVVIETDATPAQLFFGRTGNTPEGDIARNSAVSPNGSLAVSSNLNSDNLSIFDARSGSLLRYAPLDARPGEVEITPDNARAVGVNLDGFSVSVVSLATGATAAVSAPTRLAQVEIDPAGAFAYVSQIASGDGVRKLNLATNTFVGGLTATGDMGGVGYIYSQSSQIALSPDGSLLATAGGFNDRLDLVNTASMTVAQTFTPLGTFITRVSWSPEGDEVLVSDRDADAVHILRRPSPADPFSLVGSIAVGDQPFDTVALANSSRAFVINFGSTPTVPASIGVLDTVALSQTTTIPLPFTPAGMALNADGSRLVVLSATETTTIGGGAFTRVVDGELTIIDTATLAVVDRIDTNQTAAMLSTDAAGQTLAAPAVSSEVLVVIGSGCPADFNGVGGLSVQDIFDFLNAYFNADPRADFNGVGGVSVQDIFDFLNAYFAGC